MGLTWKRNRTSADLVDRAIGAVPEAMGLMANAGGDRMVEHVVRNTPIDKGNLRSSVSQKALRIYTLTGKLVYESGAETDVDYAPYVELGTGLFGPKHAKYPIVPRTPGGVLTWVDGATGKRIFAKRVMHPGSPGQHMFAIGVALTEAEFESVCKDGVRAWAIRTERSFR